MTKTISKNGRTYDVYPHGNHQQWRYFWTGLKNWIADLDGDLNFFMDDRDREDIAEANAIVYNIIQRVRERESRARE